MKNIFPTSKVCIYIYCMQTYIWVCKCGLESSDLCSDRSQDKFAQLNMLKRFGIQFFEITICKYYNSIFLSKTIKLWLIKSTKETTPQLLMLKQNHCGKKTYYLALDN